MKCTTVLTEWDIKHFLGDESGELLDYLYELKQSSIEYVLSEREVQYEITEQHYDIFEGFTRTFYESLPEAIEAFNKKVGNLPDDVNIYLADVHTGKVIIYEENFGMLI